MERDKKEGCSSHCFSTMLFIVWHRKKFTMLEVDKVGVIDN